MRHEKWSGVNAQQGSRINKIINKIKRRKGINIINISIKRQINSKRKKKININIHISFWHPWPTQTTPRIFRSAATDPGTDLKVHPKTQPGALQTRTQT